MLSDQQRRFLEHGRVGHLATADRAGVPHVIPVCYAVAGETVYITIDEKPKRRDVPLKRVRNILENPHFSFVVDRWDEDWSRLGWVMLRGARRNPRLPAPSTTPRRRCLRERYPQYRTMALAELAGPRAAHRQRDRLGRSVAAVTRRYSRPDTVAAVACVACACVAGASAAALRGVSLPCECDRPNAIRKPMTVTRPA